MDYKTAIWLAFWFFVVLTAILFYQSWVNIVYKKLTKFSFDALMLFYLRVIRGKNFAINAMRLFEKEPNRIRTLGIYAFCGAIAGIYITIDWYFHYLR
jgi:hypothetical protein